MIPQWKNSRNLKERLVIEGDLLLETPTHLGNGDTDSPLDMPLLLDPLEGKAVLPGSSLAGALRQVVRHILDEQTAKKLFGDVTGSRSQESFIIVDDALGQVPETELRDGVAIDPQTRTAEKNKKFDIELLAAGTCFPIRLELLVPKKDGGEFVQAVAMALTALEQGHIRLGKRKRRGFGRCRVTHWRVKRYDMQTLAGLKAWLEDMVPDAEGTSIADLLNVKVTLPPRPDFSLQAVFALEGSLLIRSGFGDAGAPDFVHLHSRRPGEENPVPVLSGTSLAGALRARAMRIANTLGKDGEAWSDRLFGNRQYGQQKKELTASRVWVEETVIKNPVELVQMRVKIDRFTGGSFPGALFSEQPVWGGLRQETLVYVELHLDPPYNNDNDMRAEIGLLLLVLKDLWNADLPLGGEVSVGRGRLRGKYAKLTFGDQEWEIQETNAGLSVTGDKETLEKFVQAFVEAKL